MDEREPRVRRVTEPELQGAWPDLRDAVQRGEMRVLVEHEGRPAVALVAARDLERLLRYERQRRDEFRAFQEVSDAFKDVPLEELEREVARTIAEVRAENRAREEQANPAS